MMLAAFSAFEMTAIIFDAAFLHYFSRWFDISRRLPLRCCLHAPPLTFSRYSLFCAAAVADVATRVDAAALLVLRGAIHAMRRAMMRTRMRAIELMMMRQRVHAFTRAESFTPRHVLPLADVSLPFVISPPRPVRDAMTPCQRLPRCRIAALMPRRHAAI
jgi:hypothetical protein